MATVKAIICDSGISDYQAHYIKSIDMGLGCQDDNGHGTQIAEVNSSLFDEISINSMKILDSRRQCSLDVLFNALEILKNLDVDVICLALAIDEDEISTSLLNDMRSRVLKITEQGKIIISSLHNKKNSSYPAVLQDIIGVRMVAPINKKKFYYPQKNVQCELPIEPVICQSKDGLFRPFTGNSMACAFFLTHICNTLLTYEKKISYEELELVLSGQTIQDLSFNKDNIATCKEYYAKKLLDVKYLVTMLVKEYFQDLSDNSIFQRITDIQMLNNLINSLDKLGYKINKKSFLKFSDLQTIETLSNYLILQGEVV